MPKSQVGVKPQSFVTFGEFIHYLRERAQLSQRELALQVGYHYSYISYVEKNLRVPEEATLLGRFVPALGLEDEPELVARLLELAKDRQKKPLLPVHDLESNTSEENVQQVPPSLTAMLGREREVASLGKILASPDVRLVTIVGPPGVGKTRLAVHIVESLAAKFKHGAAFVILTPVVQTELVLPTIAAALGIQKISGESVSEKIRNFLGTKNLLLVLDNFEQVVEAAPQLLPLLGSSPNVKILITSREALRVQGEYEFPLSPLSVPNDSFLDSAAVQLFIERARAVKPDFAILDQTGSRVADICRRLDGLPLAIELAAARVQTLSLSTMLEQFDRRFEWLTRGTRDQASWRKTLWGAVEWSYNLLTGQERALFNRLSVFVGEWTLEAAEEVCHDDVLLAPTDIFNLLIQLADKSLVIANAETGSFQFLETIRKFAHEKLKEGRELEQFRRRHGEYYFKFCQAIHPQLQHGDNQPHWLNVMEKEHNNLRAALAWAIENEGRFDFAAKFGVAIWRFWLLHGHFTEGRQWMEKILHLDPTPTATRADLLRCLSDFCVTQGDYARARSCEEEGLQIVKALNDEEGYYSAMAGLATIEGMQGNYALAAEYLEQAVAYRRAMKHEEQLLPLLNNLALALRRLGKTEQAQQLYFESINASRRLGNQRTLGHALNGVSEVFTTQGQYEEAIKAQRESISLRYQMGDRRGLSFSLNAFAMLLARLKKYETAVQIESASNRIFNELGLVIPAATQAENKNFIADLRGKLGNILFDDLWARGQAMTAEEVVQLTIKE